MYEKLLNMAWGVYHEKKCLQRGNTTAYDRIKYYERKKAYEALLNQNMDKLTSNQKMAIFKAEQGMED